MTEPTNGSSFGWSWLQYLCPGMTTDIPRRAIESEDHAAQRDAEMSLNKEDDFSGPYPLSSRVMVISGSPQRNVASIENNAPSTPPQNSERQDKNIPAESPLKSTAVASNKGTGKRRKGTKLF